MGVVDDFAAGAWQAWIIITAGFAELNAEGRKLQQSLVEKVRGYGMRMVGPNCLGLLNTDPAVRLNASFSPVFPCARSYRHVIPKWSARRGDPGGRSSPRSRVVYFCQRWQQSRCLRQRPAAILGRGFGHRRHLALP